MLEKENLSSINSSFPFLSEDVLLERIRSYLGEECLDSSLLKSVQAIWKATQEKDFGSALVWLEQTMGLFDYSKNERVNNLLCWLNIGLKYLELSQDLNNAAPVLSKQECSSYLDSIDNLQPGFVTPQEREFFIQQANLFLLYSLSCDLSARPTTYNQLQENLALEESYKKEFGSQLSYRPALNALHLTNIESFNVLAEKSISDSRDIKEALALFHIRDNFPKDLIEVIPFKEAQSVEDFLFFYYLHAAGRENAEQFSQTMLFVGEQIIQNQERGCALFASLYASDALNEEQNATMLSLFDSLQFELKATLMAECLNLTLEVSKQELLLNILEKSTQEQINLDECSLSLVLIRSRIDPSLKEPCNVFIKGFTRSPHSHKVKTKSANVSTHLLFYEKEGSYHAVEGIPIKDPFVSFYDKSRLAFFWLAFLVLPLAFLGVLELFVCLSDWPELVKSFFTAFCLAITTVSWFFLVYSYFGRDEAKSLFHNRAMSIFASVKLVFSLVYFIWPEQLYFLKIAAIALLVSGVFDALLTIFVFKGYARRKDALFKGPIILLALLNFLFLGLGLMNGLI